MQAWKMLLPIGPVQKYRSLRIQRGPKDKMCIRDRSCGMFLEHWVVHGGLLQKKTGHCQTEYVIAGVLSFEQEILDGYLIPCKTIL